MKNKIAYWVCQVAGWGAYAVTGTAMVAQQVGWQFSLIAGYALFFLYSIALTDLLRREMRRRQWLCTLTFRASLRLFVAALAIAAIQTFLVFAIDLMFHGRASMVFRSPAYAIPTWISVSGPNCIWLLFYVALTSGRRYREKEVRLQLALREAELRALEAQINPHFLFNCLNSIRALVVENPPVAQDRITRFASILRYNLAAALGRLRPRSERAPLEQVSYATASDVDRAAARYLSHGIGRELHAPLLRQ